MRSASRTLVPFFVPGKDVVNDALAPFNAPAASPATPPAVRRWDAATGFFVDAESPAPTPPPAAAVAVAAPRRSPALLTPAGIRRARAAATTTTTASTPISPMSPPSPTSLPSPPSAAVAAAAAAAAAATKFAGLSFETASPPPARLPLPTFVRPKAVAGTV